MTVRLIHEYVIRCSVEGCPNQIGVHTRTGAYRLVPASWGVTPDGPVCPTHSPEETPRDENDE